MREGWTRVAFGDVVRLSRERSNDPVADGFDRYVGLEHLDPGDLKVRRWGNTADGTTFTNVFRPGHVLFGKRRAYQRKVAVAEFGGVCSGDIYAFEPANARLLPGLLAFICQSDRFFDHAIGTSAGSLSPRTSWDALSRFELPLPPLEVQRSLAISLSAIVNTADCIQEALGQARLARSSWLDASLKGVSKSARLGEIATAVEYGCSLPAFEQAVGTPILRIPNVLRGVLDMTEVKRLTLSGGEMSKYLVRAGDILMVRTNGNPDYVGRCVLVPDLAEATVFASYLIRIAVDPAAVLPAFVVMVLDTPSVRARIRASVRSSAGNFNINSKEIRAIVVPMPELDIQRATLANDSSLRLSIDGLVSRHEQLTTLQRLFWTDFAT